MCKICKCTLQRFIEEITLKLLALVCNIHMFRLGTNNCDIIDISYKTKSLIENKLPKIREQSDFHEIFSVDLSINEFNASVILFKNFLIFSGHLTLTPTCVIFGGTTSEIFFQQFPLIWSLSSDSTIQNDFSFIKNFDEVSQCEDEAEKSCFFRLNHPSLKF